MSEHLRITGELIEVLPLKTGEGKNGTWQKQDFVIQTIGQYPKQVCFQVFGQNVGIIPDMGHGDITVYFNPESREYNGNYYTTLTAWKVEYVKPPQSAPAKQTPPDKNEWEQPATPVSYADDDLPF